MTKTSLIVPGFLLAGVALWVVSALSASTPVTAAQSARAFDADLHQQRRAGQADRFP